MKAHEALRAAHDILMERGWSAGAEARNALGEPVPLMIEGGRGTINPQAARLSAYGAVCAACQSDPCQEYGLLWHALSQRAQAMGAVPGLGSLAHALTAFNDAEGRTEDEVLALLMGAATDIEDGKIAGVIR